ncbi:hypothetical protein GS4_16_00450 [Gordonia soli NBRC 108243]|uniref:Uncharacterized protein n=1 Tax=Gordonia soli NBRC 108243 TaxID=1223545 RepID=M0QIR7_9ACTN|nr:hypothetical protein GS4_16_00450 [Gordonia soli NBRC 108243]
MGLLALESARVSTIRTAAELTPVRRLQVTRVHLTRKCDADHLAGNGKTFYMRRQVIFVSTSVNALAAAGQQISARPSAPGQVCSDVGTTRRAATGPIAIAMDQRPPENYAD